MLPRPETNAESTQFAVRGISHSFGAHQVLSEVTLERTSPGIIGLYGDNGTGKTTLLRICAQLIEPDVGSVVIAGHEVQRADSAAARRQTGWMPTRPLAWMELNVERNLRYCAELAGLTRADARNAAQRALEMWELSAHAQRAVQHLSRGWQQRYALARADLLRPSVLLLDEPTTGLDAAARERFHDALSLWRQDRIVVVATHEREWLSSRCDQELEL